MQLLRHTCALLTLATGFFAPTVHAAPQVEVIYEKPTAAETTAIAKRLKASETPDFIATFIDDTFKLPERLKLIMGRQDGPYYDPSKNEIVIPYFFIQEVESRFQAVDYEKTGVSPEAATNDALIHTFLHELAHALIAQYDLPIVGKEEDAADGLATVLLVHYFEEGAEIAISAADLFDLESDDREELTEEDFWGEHSLDAQRYYATLCHVYGSDPEKYAALRGKQGFPEERAERCITEYANLEHGWMKLLAPHFKEEMQAESVEQ